ncbi:MAG: hypothetical protein JXK05_04905 [Campylobacterales bacterium]|nr:hypothetical protein [Campylobacterales bacterium]
MKQMLFLLVALTLAINYYTHLDSSDAKLYRQVAMLSKRITVETALQSQIAQESNQTRPQPDQAHLLPAALAPNSALAVMQRHIETAAAAASLTPSNMRWGESFVLGDLQVRALPIELALSCTPLQWSRFVEALMKEPVTFATTQLSLSADKRTEKLSIKLQLHAFQKVEDATH